jgi:hypothetical protein
MNKYLIEYGDKVYATNADNLEEVEDKFISEFLYTGGKIYIDKIESWDDEEDIIIF